MSADHKYWMVYGNGRGAPTRKHPTKESARKEAARLAEIYLGVQFDVLKSVEVYVADRPKLKHVKLAASSASPASPMEIPF